MNAPPPLPARQRPSFLMVLPLIVFLGPGFLFLFPPRTRDPSTTPSALTGRPAPQPMLPPLEGLESAGKPVPGLDPAALMGKVSIINVWASWCVPCHDEAPLLTELGKDQRLQVIGINYKDSA